MILKNNGVISMTVSFIALLGTSSVYAAETPGAWGATAAANEEKPTPKRARAKRVKQESPQRSAVRPTHEMPPVTESPEPLKSA